MTDYACPTCLGKLRRVPYYASFVYKCGTCHDGVESVSLPLRPFEAGPMLECSICRQTHDRSITHAHE